jgi:hypothetical protein
MLQPFKYFNYFRCLLQQVLHVASVFISRCSMFHVFQMYVSYVSSNCYKNRSDIANVIWSHLCARLRTHSTPANRGVQQHWGRRRGWNPPESKVAQHGRKRNKPRSVHHNLCSDWYSSTYRQRRIQRGGCRGYSPPNRPDSFTNYCCLV